MKKILSLILLLCTTLCFIGCSNETSNNRKVERPNIEKQSKSESIDMNVYIDGTYSMSGYVNYSGSTVYDGALKNIETTAMANWKQDNIQYFKFGDSIQPISYEQFLNFNKVSFYQEKDTSLQKVIVSMDAAKFNILISDMFQTNQDINSLVKSLKNICFNDNSKAMALIGIKSQFNGKVYDVGKNYASFSYSSTEEKESYRPFYLLVIGNEADVRLFTDNYIKTFKQDDLVKVVLFSKNMGTEILLSPGKAIPNNNKEKLANMAQISTMLGSGSDILQYRLKLDEKKSGFNSILTAGGVIGNVPDNFSEFTFNVEKWDTNGKFTPITAKNFVEVTGSNVGLRDGNVNLNLLCEFNPSSIKRTEGKYRINLSLFPAKEDYLQSNKVFEEWNFNNELVVTPEELQAVGGKTLNITYLVDRISMLNYEMNKPGFYNIYVYLEALN